MELSLDLSHGLRSANLTVSRHLANAHMQAYLKEGVFARQFVTRAYAITHLASGIFDTFFEIGALAWSPVRFICLMPKYLGKVIGHEPYFTESMSLTGEMKAVGYLAVRIVKFALSTLISPFVGLASPYYYQQLQIRFGMYSDIIAAHNKRQAQMMLGADYTVRVGEQPLRHTLSSPGLLELDQGDGKILSTLSQMVNDSVTRWNMKEQVMCCEV